MTRLEQIENRASQGETPLTAPAVEVDYVTQRYSGLVQQYPELSSHLSAIEKLQRKNPDLSDDDKEVLLIYSLWTEDPRKAIEIAQSLDISERTVNEYVDAVREDPEGFGDTLFGIVNDLRRKVQPSPPVASTSEPQDEETPQKSAPPFVPRSVMYAEVEKAPIHGNLAQSYDHPVLNSGQERTFFRYLKSGASIEEVRQDANFINSFDGEDRPKIARILDQSATVEEAISSCYLRLVDVIARSAKQIPLRDAINAGNIGLFQAARKWEPREKGRFSTYAVWAIRSAVQQEENRARSPIVIPAYVRQDLAKAKWVVDAFQAIFGRVPTNEELRKQLLANTDIPRWRVNTLIRVIESKIQHVGSINAPISTDGDSEDEIGDFVADTTVDVEGSVVQKIANEELRRETKRALKEHLTPEEQQIIKALYGLDGFEERTSEEVAREMRTTPERVIDIERKSLEKLRYDKWLREHWAEDPPSFIYGRSAEKAAFRLGLFDDYTVLSSLDQPNQQKEDSNAREVQLITASQEAVIFEQAKQLPLIEQTQVDGSTGVDILTDEQKVQNQVDTSRDDLLMLTLGEKIEKLGSEGLSSKEIAERLGVKISTVYSAGSKFRRRIENGKLIPFPEGRVVVTEAQSISKSGAHAEQISDDDPLKIYKEAFLGLRGKHGIEITPDEGEVLEELQAAALQAAQEIGKPV